MDPFRKVKTKTGQAVVEYIVTFLALAAGIIAVFTAFNPGNNSINSTMSSTVSRAVENINGGWN